MKGKGGGESPGGVGAGRRIPNRGGWEEVIFQEGVGGGDESPRGVGGRRPTCTPTDWKTSSYS